MENFFTLLNDWIEIFANNPYVTVTGFVVGVAGFVYAVYIARRDRKIKLLRYRLSNSNLIENGKTLYPKLEVTYDGRKLDNFSITKVRIFNDGTEVVRPVDIAPNDPIQIKISDNTIEMLESALIYSSNQLNDFKIQQIDKNIIQIEFDYIESNNSATIQLLHTGKDSNCIDISGTVIGAKKPFVSSISKTFRDTSMIDSPFGNMLNKIAFTSSRKLFMIIFSLLGILIFGTLTYFLLTSSNYLIGVICAIPTTFFVFAIIVFTFSRNTSVNDGVMQDLLRTLLLKALSGSEKSENQDL